MLKKETVDEPIIITEKEMLQKNNNFLIQSKIEHQHSCNNWKLIK